MTPTEQDKKLRRLISDLMADLMVDVSLKKLSKYDGDIIEKGRLYLESHNDRLDIIMQLITADRKRVELKARLNEIQNAYEYWINGTEFIASYFRDRIALLSNTKESKDEQTNDQL